MEEKKLTDEEVIKGLECCSKGCRDKSCFGSEMDGITDCPAKQYCNDYKDEKEWELQNG